MKKIYFLTLIVLSSCNSISTNTNVNYFNDVNQILDTWHLHATNANLAYFDIIADDGIYIGTAKEEVWSKKEFL